MIPTPVDEATHLRDMRGGSQRGREVGALEFLATG